MSVSPTVLVACDDLILLDEVIRHLEEIPHWRLVMSARTADELVASNHRPDFILVADQVAIQLADHPRAGQLRAGLVAFGRQETTAVLRAALKLGARGFVEWPDQKQRLQVLVEGGLVSPQEPSAPPSGALHAVWAPKGGAGATVIAAHLTGTLARLGREAILIDLDLDHADQTCVLGAEPAGKTVGDLLRVAEELTVPTVQSVLWSHPLGFRAVLAPGRSGAAASVGEEAVRRVLRTVRETAQHVVADLPSGLGLAAHAAMRDATSVHLVLTPDLLGLRRARDLFADLKASGVESSRIQVVLNQAGGTEISAQEVEAVLGVKEVTRVRADLQIYRAVNRGELSPVACKLLTPLAVRLTAAAGGVSPAVPAPGRGPGRRVRQERAAVEPVPATARVSSPPRRGRPAVRSRT